MIKLKYILCFAVILFFNTKVFIAAQSHSTSIYNAYVNDNMEKWKNIMDQMEIENDISKEKKMELLNYYYGYTAYYVGKKDEKKIEKYIEKAEKLIKEILESDPNNSTAYAYKGSFIAFKIGMSKIKAPLLGPEGIRSINKAYELNKNDVQAVADKANMLYYTPSIMGGDKQEAIKFYEKAVELMENKSLIRDNWQYLSILTALAKRYDEMGYTSKAKSTYEKVLKIEPNFKLVRDQVYPDFLKKT